MEKVCEYFGSYLCGELDECENCFYTKKISELDYYMKGTVYFFLIQGQTPFDAIETAQALFGGIESKV